MTALAIFCFATVAFLVPRDLLIAHTRDVEVWFGFEVHGAAARLTAPLHWALFLAGAWGFWRNRPWVVPAAAAYAFYIAFSHIVWSEASPNGRGWPIGLAQALVLCVPGVLLWRVHRITRGKQRPRQMLEADRPPVIDPERSHPCPNSNS
jgi:hypothetical protein